MLKRKLQQQKFSVSTTQQANWNHYIFKQLVIHSNGIHCIGDSNTFLKER